MPMVKERLRRATAMSAPSLAMACRRRSGRTDLFFVAFIRSHKIDLKRLKVYFKISYSTVRDLCNLCKEEVSNFSQIAYFVYNASSPCFLETRWREYLLVNFSVSLAAYGALPIAKQS